MTTEAVVIIWLICSAIGAAIGNQKGLAVQGAVLGLCLGIFGVIIVAVMPARNTAPHSSAAIANHGVSPSLQSGSGGAGLADSLRELDALHAEGLLTDNEFRGQKRLLLGFGDGDLSSRASNANPQSASPPIDATPLPVSPPSGPVAGHHYCEECGTRLADAVKFCSNCGAVQG
jgi:hypothetical protein